MAFLVLLAGRPMANGSPLTITIGHSQIYLIDSEGRNMHAVTSGNYENVVPELVARRDGDLFRLQPHRKLAGVEAGTGDRTGNAGDPPRRLCSI